MNPNSAFTDRKPQADMLQRLIPDVQLRGF